MDILTTKVDPSCIFIEELMGVHLYVWNTTGHRFYWLHTKDLHYTVDEPNTAVEPCLYTMMNMINE